MVPPLSSTALAIQQAVFAKKLGQRPRAMPGDEIRLALGALQGGPDTDRFARAACGAVQDLLRTDQDCQAALDADAVPVLTSTLLRYGACPAVMMNGLAALLQLASSGQAHAQLARREVLGPLVRALRPHRAQWDVMAIGLALLAELAGTPAGRRLLFASHAIDLAIEAMLTHPRKATVQSLGAELLHHMAEGSAAQEGLLALGAAETLVEAVRGFPQERDVQQRALTALSRLCETDETRAAIAQVGGVDAILHAVHCNYEDLLIARYGCAVLWELALSSAVRKQIIGYDAKALMKRILLQHSHDPELVVHARALLWKIAGRSLKLPHTAMALVPQRQSVGCSPMQPTTRALDTARHS